MLRLAQYTSKRASRTAIASAFLSPNSAATLNKKPGLFASDGGAFKRKEFTSSKLFIKAVNECRTQAMQMVDKVSSVPAGPATVQAIDELSDTICQVADPANFLQINHPDEHIRAAAGEAGFQIGGLVEELNNTVSLQEALKLALQEKIRDEETRIVGELLLRDFDQCGVNISEEQRAKAVNLHHVHIDVMQAYQQNCQEPGVESIEYLPEHCKNHLFPKEKYSNHSRKLTISSPWSTQRSEFDREAVWRIFHTKNLADGSQMDLLDKIVKVRHELATIYGYESWAARAVEHSMARSPAMIEQFLWDIIDQLQEGADAERENLLKKKAIDTYAYDKTAIYPWDEMHYDEQLFSKESHSLTEYLSLVNCMNGVANIANKLFGYTFEPVRTEPGEVWHSDVIKLDIKKDGEVIAHIYCDLFARPDKSPQECHYTIRCSRKLPNDSYQLPIIVVSLNFNMYTRGQKIKLNFDQAKTFFHEFGHAIHSISGRTAFQHVSGTRCQTDIAEVPSILMEYFFEDDRVVQTWAKNDNGEPMPLELWHQFTKKKSHLAATELIKTCRRSLWDQHIHGTKEQLSLSPIELEHKLIGSLYGEKFITNNHTAESLRFNHLLQYDAKFYAYQLSTAFAGRIWDKLFIDDPFSQKAGAKYMKEFLRHGGGRDPRKMYENLLGEEVDAKLLAQTVVKHL